MRVGGWEGYFLLFDWLQKQQAEFEIYFAFFVLPHNLHPILFYFFFICAYFHYFFLIIWFVIPGAVVFLL